MTVLADSLVLVANTLNQRITLSPLLPGQRILQLVVHVPASAISANLSFTVRTRNRTIIVPHAPTRDVNTYIEFTKIKEEDVELVARFDNNTASTARVSFAAVLIEDPAPKPGVLGPIRVRRAAVASGLI